MIRFVEEILLLTLDEEHGDLGPAYSARLLDIVVAGAVLMELALEERLDTDLERLVLVDSTPLEDDLLDPTLADIAAGPSDCHADFWLVRTAKRSGEIRDRALTRLVERGILEAEAGAHFLSRIVSRARRYPARDGRAVDHVRLRIMRALFSDEIPDPRDVVLICLSDASGVLRRLLTPAERTRLAERIELMRNLDLIGRSVLAAIERERRAAEAPEAARPPTEIPVAKGLPLLGSALSMTGNISPFFARQYVALGPVFRVRALHRRLLVLAGPEAMRFLQHRGRVHLRESDVWRHFNWEMGTSESITTLEGAPHARLRKAMAPGIAPPRLNERLGDFLRVTRLELDRWCEAGTSVRLRPALQRMISRQAGMVFAGLDSTDFWEEFDVLLTAAVTVHVAGLRPKWWLKRPRVARARRRQNALFEEIMAAREAGGSSGPPDVIDDLLELHRTDPQLLPEEDLRFAVLSPLYAGLHTSSLTCVFVLYEALKRPGLLKAMTAEADALFSGGLNAVPRLSQLDVTHRFAMETLRVYSLIPGTMRRVTNSFSFAGYRIPAGEEIFFAWSVPHHLPEHFPDPGRFDIERYTPERAEHRAPGVFLPFGVGAHRCLGMGFGQMQIALTLATILHEVDLAMTPPRYRLKASYRLTPRPADSFKVVARRRRRESDGAVRSAG